MKLIKLLLLCLAGAFCVSAASGQTANASLNILTLNSGQVNLGGVVDIQVTLGNTGPGNIVANKVRVQISVPIAIANPLPNAQQTGLPPGWTITANTGGVIVVCNGSDVIPAGVQRQAFIKVQGNALGGPSTVNASLIFNGALCTVPGSLPGDNTSDNTGTSSIQVIPAGACNLAVSASAGTIACNGGTATLTATATGGTGALEYSLNGGAFQSGNTFTVNAAGSPYTVVAREAGTPACTATSSAITVTQPSALSASATSTPVTTIGGTNGTATVTAAGGTTPYTYLWTPGGQTTATATGLAAGSYSVTVTDANGCTTTATTTVAAPACALSVSASAGTIACNGGTATLTATATGANGAVEYSLNGGAFQSANTFTVSAGTYTVTAREVSNTSCTATAIAVTVSQPTQLVATSSATAILCNGGNSTVTVSATGGTAPYTGTGTFSRTAGTYTFTVTDANGCTATTSVTITEPSVLTATATSTPVTTIGGTDGTATAVPAGGTTPYTYSWNTTPVQTTVTATGLTAGSYTVTVTDTRGCTTTATTTVSSPSCNLAVSASAGTIACNGGTTTLTATATGANGTVEYSLNGGAFQSANTFTVSAGTYTVTAREVNNTSCTATATAVTVSQPTQLVAASSATAILCNGGNSTVTVSATGGTAPYTGTGTFSRTAGTYTFTVTDANGCTATTSVTITQPTALTATATSTPVTTTGGNNGTATAVPAGGIAPYTYSWNTTPVQTTVTVTGLTAGSYTVTVTDANGCTATATTTVGSPACNVTLSFTQVNVLCFGASTGSATVTAANTTGTVTYLWSNGQTTATATGLVAGTYSVTVTDGGGCTATGSVTITQPTQLVASSTAPPITTAGGSTTVTVSATGGTAPYTGTGTFTRTAGTYTFTVTDANGCTATTTITLTEPGCNVTLTTAVTNVSCFGGSNGAINLTVAGATAPVTYNWSNGATTEDISGLVAGNYTVIVTDANECTATATVTISQPEIALTASTVATNVLCFGAGTGSINLTVNGGTPPYTYSWSNGAATEDINGLIAGTYTVTITDSKGCTAGASATITQPASELVASSTAPPITTAGGSTTVTVAATGGTAPYTGTGTFTRTAGTYTFIITDANGCTASTTITLTDPGGGCNITLNTMVTNVKCFGSHDGAVDLTVTGAALPVTYLWSLYGITTEDLTDIPAGTYTVTVTDANACTATKTVVVTQPAELIVTGTAGIIPCNETTTTVIVTATGGTPPYTGTGTFIRGAGGNHFTVTDANGCSKNIEVIIAPPVECPEECTKTQTITQDFVRTSISSGRYIWFNSVIDLDERCGNEPVIVNVTDAKIQYKKNNTWITLNVPDAVVTFSANTFWSTTQFVNGKWETKAPLRTYGKNVFMAGLSYMVPSGGIPAGIDDVKWTASININREGVKIKCKWAAAVYTQFSSNYNALGVKPIDGYWFNPYFNRNKAGTPEFFKNRLTSGGTGRGNNNYTGSFSNSKSVQCGDCECEDNHNYNRSITTDVSDDQSEPKGLVMPESDFKVIVKSNPSNNHFDLQLVGTDNKTPVTIRIADMYGRVISGSNQRISNNTTLRVGDSWISGTYVVEITQGDKRKVIKLIKTE